MQVRISIKRERGRGIKMSRNFAAVLHGIAIVLGQITSGSILSIAARVYGWSEDYKDLLVQFAFLLQGGIQTLLAWYQQGFNIDGTRPGEVPQATITRVVPQPGEGPTTTTATIEPVQRKEN